MNKNELRQCADLLLVTLAMKGEYYQAAGLLEKKVLLVEGVTDQRFLNRVKTENTDFLCVSDFMRAAGAFAVTAPRLPTVYCREVIVSLIKYVSVLPEYVQFPVKAKDWPLYGLVDNDFESSAPYAAYQKLFFTETHDLETFMLSTDPGLVRRLPGCEITDAEVSRAYYLADQLAGFRLAMMADVDFTQRNVLQADGTVDYGRFLNGEDRIDLELFVKYLNGNRKKPYSSKKLRAAAKKLKEGMRKLLDEDGCWRRSFREFCGSDRAEFWKRANGHDIASAICFVNKDAAQRFRTRGSGFNRSLEVALNKNYDYACGADTVLFRKLYNAGLIVDVSETEEYGDGGVLPDEFDPARDGAEEDEFGETEIEEDDADEDASGADEAPDETYDADEEDRPSGRKKKKAPRHGAEEE
jgi:hypothetical protein